MSEAADICYQLLNRSNSFLIKLYRLYWLSSNLGRIFVGLIWESAIVDKRIEEILPAARAFYTKSLI